MLKSQNGNSIITTPIIIAIGLILVSILIVTTIKILMPYIWYEKLSSTCIKYIFVIEEYGYLSKKEARLLMNELCNQGFDKNNIKLQYTSKAVSYGEPIFLRLNYEYELELPLSGKQTIPMQIERNSICKR